VKRILCMICVLALLLSAMSVMPLSALAAGKGDLNGDGEVTTSDVRQLLYMAVADTEPTQKQLWWGDYNIDGKISTLDGREALLMALTTDGRVDYMNVDNSDWCSEKSIALLGDSISFGAGVTGNIADVSYAGIIKNAISNKLGGVNYGFMPAYTVANWSPMSAEVCGWPTMTGGPGVVGNDQGWTETDSGDRLMTFGLTAYKQYASLTYQLRSGYNFKYVCVYYQTGPSYGQFVVANNTSEGGFDQPEVGQTSAKVYDCENTVAETKRTGFFEVANFPNGISINIVSGDNQPVTITGLGFYDDISGTKVTFNKYTRGGAMLTPLSDRVLQQAASADTLIVGLGYNDFFWGNEYNYTKADFSNRIDYLIAQCNKNGTKVIVNDYLWSNYKTLAQYQAWSAATRATIDDKYTFFHAELKRLAAETKGVYINQEEYNGQAIITQANNNDGVHPTNEGHRMMAQPILEAMGLS